MNAAFRHKQMRCLSPSSRPSRSVVAKSTLKVFRSRLLTPINSAPIFSARSSSDSSWTSTNTASPASIAKRMEFLQLLIGQDGHNQAKSHPHPIRWLPGICRSSMMKSLRKRGSLHSRPDLAEIIERTLERNFHQSGRKGKLAPAASYSFAILTGIKIFADDSSRR